MKPRLIAMMIHVDSFVDEAISLGKRKKEDLTDGA
jgi:hypothetical protein